MPGLLSLCSACIRLTSLDISYLSFVTQYTLDSILHLRGLNLHTRYTPALIPIATIPRTSSLSPPPTLALTSTRITILPYPKFLLLLLSIPQLFVNPSSDLYKLPHPTLARTRASTFTPHPTRTLPLSTCHPRTHRHPHSEPAHFEASLLEAVLTSARASHKGKMASLASGSRFVTSSSADTRACTRGPSPVR